MTASTKQILTWLVPVLARGIAWALAVRLGIESVQAEDLGLQIATAIGTLVLSGVSVYTSIKGRQKILQQEPPLMKE